MFRVRVVTPEASERDFRCTQLNIDTPSGQMGILSHHMPLVTKINISMLTTIFEGERKRYAISGGVLFFQDNEATIMADAFEHEGEIDISRAEKAKQRAEQRLKSADESIDYKRAELALKRAINRINLKG